MRRPLIAYRQHGATLSRRLASHHQQLALLAHKHADLAGGRDIDWGVQHRFVGSEELRVGARTAALRAFARAIAHGDTGSVPRALGTLLPRSMQGWLQRTVLSDRAWLSEARSWLTAQADPGPA